MVGWFQKMFVGSVLAASTAAPMNAEQVNQDTDKTIPTEQVTNQQRKENNSDSPRIFQEKIIMDEDSPFPTSQEGLKKYGQEKAYFESNKNRIICKTFVMSDECAFNRAKDKLGKDAPCDLDEAMKAFQSTLKDVGYEGKMPQTIQDADKIIQKIDSQLKEKKQIK